MVAFMIVFSAVMIFTPKGKFRNIFANIWLAIGGFTMGVAGVQFGEFDWFSAFCFLAGIYFLVKTILVLKKEYIEGEDEF